jgi:uncharacterized membrane protein
VGGLKLFGHPLHAALVHFPMALLGAAPIWDGLALALGDARFWSVGFFSVAAGTIAAVPTAAAGMADLAALPSGSPAEQTAMRHMTAALLAVSAFGGSLVARGGASAPEGGRLVATLALDLAGVAILGLVGFLGGELVYKHQIGVTPPLDRPASGPETLPRPEGER